MRTITANPELMTVICNIQGMKKVIDPNYNETEDFKTLEKMTDDELHILQDKVIDLYNNATSNQWMKRLKLK